MSSPFAFLRQIAYGRLRALEPYTRTDMVYLAKGGFWLALGSAGVSLLAFILVLVFANVLSPEVYGTYKYIFSAAGLLGIFTLSGIGSALSRSIARGSDGTITKAFFDFLKWSSFSSALMLLVGGYYFFRGNEVLAFSLLIAALGTPLVEGGSLFMDILTGKAAFRMRTILLLARNALATIALCVTALLSQSVVLLVLVYFLTYGAFSLAAFWYTKKAYQKNNEDDPIIGSFGKHLSFLQVLNSIANNLDQVLIFQTLGAAPLAAYFIATNVPLQAENLVKVAAPLAIPKLAARPIEVLKRTLPFKALLMFIGVALFATLLIFVLPFLYALALPQYIASAPLSQLAALGMLATPAMLFTQTFISHARKRELYILKIGTPIIRITLLVILLPLYGIWGAVYALLGARILNGLASLTLFLLLKAPASK